MRHTIWYRTATGKGNYSIEEVPVVKSSSTHVTVLIPASFIGQKDCTKPQKKHSDHQDFWPTLAEAEQCIKKKAEGNKASALKDIEKADAILTAGGKGYLYRPFVLREKVPFKQPVV
jgi:hypothetical protein